MHIFVVPLSPRTRALYVEVGRRVSDFRNSLPGNVTQSDVAARTSGELSRSAIANIETGRHRVALHQLYVLADALGCRPEEFFPSAEEFRSTAKMPRGAREEDPAATMMMERLEREREVSVLTKRRI
jgi:transcriptional regulator with XRE-family HTH domain